MDNFFTSLPMAKKLYENEIAIIGTLRQNKPQIPECFLADNKKELFSSQFAFDKYLTLVSYTRKVTHPNYFIEKIIIFFKNFII
jgi:hypothetical protein